MQIQRGTNAEYAFINPSSYYHLYPKYLSLFRHFFKGHFQFLAACLGSSKYAHPNPPHRCCMSETGDTFTVTDTK